MLKWMGGMATIGMAGYGAYQMVNKKMPKSKVKKMIHSPYVMDASGNNVKSN